MHLSGFLLAYLVITSAAVSIHGDVSNGLLGINYGTVGDNLPTPSQVSRLIQSTIFTKIKLYNPNPAILTAFGNSGIEVVVGIPNEIVGNLTDPDVAKAWVKQNVVLYSPATEIKLLAVGNEVLATDDKVLTSQLVPCMQNLHTALVSFGLDSRVKISSPHSLGILHTSVPPSSGSFGEGLSTALLQPMLDFLSKTGAPFMINAYPYFGYAGNPIPDALQYALFTSTTGYTDPNTSLHYTNMFDAMLDATYSAMAALGYPNLDLIVTETGWPSAGDPSEVGASLQNAQTYNTNLIKHIHTKLGTPLRPNQPLETYIFALFNEDLKSGAGSERNYGLFRPDMTQVYNAGVMKNLDGDNGTAANATTPSSQKRWCVASPSTDPSQLSRTLSYACGAGGANCSAIQASQPCYLPNTLLLHASFAMNSFFHKQGGNPWDCAFNNTGVLVTSDPSYGSCIYPSS